jgi:hypothetical protein
MPRVCRFGGEVGARIAQNLGIYDRSCQSKWLLKTITGLSSAVALSFLLVVVPVVGDFDLRFAGDEVTRRTV